MSKFAAQLNIVKKIKSLVKKARYKFIPYKSTDNAISEKVALQIQKNAYDLSRRQQKDTYTPIYLEIAEQLQANDSQIFQAAVNSLADIALNKQFKPEIYALLEKQLKNPKRTEEQLAYLQQTLALIK